jgi:hypothetical protein
MPQLEKSDFVEKNGQYIKDLIDTYILKIDKGVKRNYVINYPNLAYASITNDDGINEKLKIHEFNTTEIVNIFNVIKDRKEFENLISDEELNVKIKQSIYDRYSNIIVVIKDLNGFDTNWRIYASYQSEIFKNFLYEFRNFFLNMERLHIYTYLKQTLDFSYDEKIKNLNNEAIKSFKSSDIISNYFVTKEEFENLDNTDTSRFTSPEQLNEHNTKKKLKENTYLDALKKLKGTVEKLLENAKRSYNSMANLPFVVFFQKKTILYLEKTEIFQDIIKNVNPTMEEDINSKPMNTGTNENEKKSLSNIKNLFFGSKPKENLTNIVKLLKEISDGNNKENNRPRPPISFQNFMVITEYLNGLNSALQTASGIMPSVDNQKIIWGIEFFIKQTYKAIINTKNFFSGMKETYDLPDNIKNNFIKSRDTIYEEGDDNAKFEAYSSAFISEIREIIGLKDTTTNNKKIDINNYPGIKLITNYKNLVFITLPHFKTKKNNSNDVDEFCLDEESIVDYWANIFGIDLNTTTDKYSAIKESINELFFSNLNYKIAENGISFLNSAGNNIGIQLSQDAKKLIQDIAKLVSGDNNAGPLLIFSDELKKQLKNEMDNFHRVDMDNTKNNKFLIKLCYYFNRHRFDNALLASSSILALIPEIVSAKNINDAIAKNPFKIYYQLSKNEYKPEELFLNSLIEQFQTYAPQDIYNLEECIILTTPDRKVFFCGFKQINEDWPIYIPNNLLLGDNPFLAGGEQLRPEVPSQMAYAILDKIIKENNGETVLTNNILIDKISSNSSKDSKNTFHINTNVLKKTIEKIINEKKNKKDKNQNEQNKQNKQNNKNDDSIDLTNIDINTLIRDFNPFKLYIRFNHKSSNITEKKNQKKFFNQVKKALGYVDKYVFEFGTVDKDGNLVPNEFDRKEVSYEDLQTISKKFCEENGVCTSNIEYTITQKGRKATDEMIGLEKNPENTANTKRGGRIHNIKNKKPQIKKQENKKTRKNGKK